MRKVFDNSMVAHLWANQSQSEARSQNGNFWYADTIIYSYRTPIARLVTGVDGAQYVMRTSETFSVTTTGKHENAINRALSREQRERVFHVPFISSYRGNHYQLETLHVNNVAYLQDKFNRACEEVLNMRTRFDGERYGNNISADIRISFLNRRENTVRDYCAAFGLEVPAEIRTNLLETEQAIQALIKKYYNPKNVKRREKQRAKSAQYREARERKKQAEEARRNFVNNVWRGLAAIAYPYDLEQWRNHERARAPQKIYGARYERGHAIRLSKDGAQIETSGHATIPTEHAKRLWPFIVSCHDNGRELDMSGASRSIRLGHFTLNKIDAQGNIRVGCHDIAYPELLRMAQTLNLTLS